jgi:glutaredoxin
LSEPQQRTSLPQVKFYTKTGCHLCEEARDLLDDIAAQVPFDLTEIDIRGDLTVFAEYRYRIPVISINTKIVAEGRIEYEDLASAFQL